VDSKHIRGEKLGISITKEQMKQNKKHSNSTNHTHKYLAVSTCIQLLNFSSFTNQTPTTPVYLGYDFFD